MSVLTPLVSGSVLFAQRALVSFRQPILLHGKTILSVNAFTSDVKPPTKVPKPLPTTLLNLEFPSVEMLPIYLDTEQKGRLNDLFTSFGQPARAALDEVNAPYTEMLEVNIRLRKGPIQRRCWIDFSNYNQELKELLDELVLEEYQGQPIEMPNRQDWAMEDDIKLWLLSQIHLVKLEEIAEVYFEGERTAEECRARRAALESSSADYTWDARDQAVREYDRLEAIAKTRIRDQEDVA
ncbi:hypothetical protein BDZ88DRAFT_438539 [Geranomyces variabilis]|nr:hypothetical protein BDZ88DRAFT_438539 [Geranomyces variabilis]KAJ3141260.1 hypothetical protein HDU90_007287 [Geranomyces variabilis]